MTDTVEGFNNASGHIDDPLMPFYGGTLIAESIHRKEDVSLISAAPDLLEACIAAKAIFEAEGITKDHRIVGGEYTLIVDAIIKATE